MTCDPLHAWEALEGDPSELGVVQSLARCTECGTITTIPNLDAVGRSIAGGIIDSYQGTVLVSHPAVCADAIHLTFVDGSGYTVTIEKDDDE